MTVKTDQLARTQSQLRRAIKNIEGVTQAGLLAAAFVVLRDSGKRVPVEYGNLRASGYARKHPSKVMAAEVGYTAAYAFAVHENVEEKGRGKPRPSGISTYWNPGESKFLEKALTAQRREILATVARYARRETRG